jgi:hypothetical protein
MRYITIFPSGKNELGTKIMIGSAGIICDNIEDAMKIAITTVPEGWPFMLYEYDLYDKMFHTAYDPDWSIPSGYGIDSKMKIALLEAGHTQNW